MTICLSFAVRRSDHIGRHECLNRRVSRRREIRLSIGGALRSCLNEGALVISGVVFVETMPLFPSTADFINALAVLNIETVSVAVPSFLTAASAWKEYRKEGGAKNRVVADFLIGAHAQDECDRLLTRDRGFYRKYFKNLKIVEPR